MAISYTTTEYATPTSSIQFGMCHFLLAIEEDRTLEYLEALLKEMVTTWDTICLLVDSSSLFQLRQRKMAYHVM